MEITVLRVAHNDLSTELAQISASAFIGSLAAPNNDVGSPLEVFGVSTNTSINYVPANLPHGAEVTLDNVASGTLYQESKRDMAAFDIDRYPYITENADPPEPFNPTAEDTDIGVGPTTPSGVEGVDHLPAGEGIYTEYVEDVPGVPEKYRLICTMGGYVFGTEPSRVADLVLQTNNIEPPIKPETNE